MGLLEWFVVGLLLTWLAAWVACIAIVTIHAPPSSLSIRSGTARAGARRPQAGGRGGAVTVAYLINQYPKISHTFIRREIHALERQGVEVRRFALRGWSDVVTDAADQAEKAKTRYVLQRGLIGLLPFLAVAALLRPLPWFRALRLTLRLSTTSRRSAAHHLAYLAEACWLLFQLRGIGHLHVHFGTNGAQVAWLCRLLGGPAFSVTVHGPEEFDHVDSLALPEIAAAAQFVAVVSTFGRSQICRWLPVAQWSKVHVVHCGLEAAWLQEPPRPPVAAARLVCVGRLCEQKGQLLLVQAAVELAKAGERFELALVGDGELRGEIETLIAQHGLGRFVSITGWVDSERVGQELRDARALVLPSFAEGLPVVLMEAMALGRPVVTTWVAGIPELVRPGVDGWLVAPGDRQALVDALRELLHATPQRLAGMGAAARERVAERHDIDRIAQQLSRLFAASLGTVETQSAPDAAAGRQVDAGAAVRTG